MKRVIFLACLLICRSGIALQCTGITTISKLKEAHWGSKVAMNGAGAAEVAWVQLQGDNRILHAAVRANASADWEPSQRISTSAHIEAFMPFVAGDGMASVIWKIRDQNGKNQYFFSKKAKSADWSPSELIGNPSDPLIRDVNFDPRGQPFVLASPENETRTQSYHYSGNEKTSTENALITASEKKVNLPQIIKNKEGDIAAFWIIREKISWSLLLQTDVFDYQLHCSQYKDQDKWHSHKKIKPLMGLLSTTSDTASDISVSINKDKNLAIIWSHFNAATAKHSLKSIVVPGKEAVGEITATGDGYAESAIALDNDGNTVAAWIRL